MNEQRRHFADHEKVAILKRHLIDKVPVSNLCDELQLYPNQFYDWLKKFFENGHLAFANGRKSKAVEEAKDHKIQQLEAKLTRKKNEVMVELMEALDLWAVANRLTPYDAAVDLCQRLHIPLPLLTPPPIGNREEAAIASGSDTCTIP